MHSVATTTIAMPSFGQTAAESTLVAWLKKKGDRVERGEPLADVETDKTTVQVEAFVAGYLRETLCPAGSLVAAGEPIALLTSSLEEPIEEVREAPNRKAESPPRAPTPPPQAAECPRPTVSPKALSSSPRILATPAAKRLAEAHGIDLSRVTGSGPGGRILEGDVRSRIENARPADDATAEYRELSPLRRATAARMVQSVREAPQFSLAVDVDMTEVERLRARASPKPSSTAIIVKAVVTALRTHPQLNVAYENDRIRSYRDVHIGLAVSTPRGLLAPVLRHADRMSVEELTAAIEVLQTQARNGKLPGSALGGATFTVSNLGMLGVDRFTAILNPPEAGILAVGRVAPRPVAVGAAVESRPVGTLTLTVDHRVVDGAEAAAFLSAVRENLERPSG
jgi:pyruvate dehydrogenase E2 component (dihydrolipoamide acetyltransferase)